MRVLLYLSAIFFIIFCSCSDSHSRHDLDEAEALLLTDPSAAMARLNGYDVAEFKDSATMARWALLYSEALVANRFSAPNDTIVNIAVRYYGSHDPEGMYLRASQLKELLCSSGNVDELAEALYIQKEKEFYLYKERTMRQHIILVAVIVLLFAAAIIIWMRQRMKLQSARNDMLMAEASDLKSRIEASRGDVGRLETKLHGLLENRFSLIDSLCQTYYETQGTKTDKKAIVEKVKKEIESVRTDSFHEIEKAVNDCRDNMLVKAKAVYPEIKPEDYQLLVYLSGGLSTRTICLLLDESVDVIYKRKSRLKARLKERAESGYDGILEVF